MKPYFHNSHGKPVSRRELLGQGFLGATSSIALPSLLGSMTSQSALAKCAEQKVQTTPKLPFLSLDLVGGGSLAGSNIMVGGPEGQLDFLPGYRFLGLPDQMHPKNPGYLNQELGLAFHGDSGILRGILATTSAATRANLEGTIFCTRTIDDTEINPLNPSYWIAKSIIDESSLVPISGNVDTASGSYTHAPLESLDASLRPALITGEADITNYLDIGRVAQFLPAQDIVKILSAVEKMSTQKLAQFSNMHLKDQLKELIRCRYIKSGQITKAITDGRFNLPSQDQDYQNLFANIDNENEVTGVSLKSLIDGISGTATVALGGFDYHTNLRSTGEIRDYKLGLLLGRCFEYAARKQSDLVIYCFSDGANTIGRGIDESEEGRGKYVWLFDRGLCGSSAMFVYKHDGRPSLRKESRQVGSFDFNTSGIKREGKIWDSPTNLTQAVVANYLALQGRESELSNIVGTHPFKDDLDDYLTFNKLR